MVKVEGRADVWVDEALCKGTEGCGICIHVCPANVLGPSETLSRRGVHPAAVISPERCTGCELCMIHCPDLAVVVQTKKVGRDG